MDVLCLFGLFPKEYENDIVNNSKAGVQHAANKLQWGIVSGLDMCENVNVQICNSLYIGSFPKRYKRMMIPTFDFSHAEGAKDINVGFCNLSLYKYYSRYRGCKKHIEEWIHSPSKDKKAILVYALTIPFAQLAGYFQRKYPDITVCVVVPDLPEYMNVGLMEKNKIYATLKAMEIRWIRKSLSNVQNFILLTEPMKDWFRRDIRYTVVEGIAPTTNSREKCVKEKTILYAGGIKREYGLVDLVTSFMRIEDPEWQLVIYGDGSDFRYLQELSKDDTRVKLMGARPNAEVVEHQMRASVLVNPRKNQEFARFSFPSKMLEYMASGTAVLAYKLDGVPDEYSDFYYQILENDNGLADSLSYVMSRSQSELEAMGERARNFVLSKKSPAVQGKKIIELLMQK